MSVPMYKVARLMDEVHEGHYEVFPGYTGLSLAQAQDAYNEVGPDKWTAWQRSTATKLVPILDVPAFLHDLEAIHCNDGTREGFEAWNARFLRNGRRHVRLTVPAWRVLTRILYFAEVKGAYLLISSSEGWDAWQKAYAKSAEPGPEAIA